MKRVILIVLILSLFSQAFSQVLQWRGPNRDGMYPETNLLKEWPEDGPKMLWSNDDIPNGYASVSISDGYIYTTGRVDTIDYLIAMDMDGKVKWKTAYGKSWMDSFSESRCTPTIEGQNIYVTSGNGDVACINAKNGKIKWSLDASKEFNGTFGIWGISESILIVDNKIIYTPGGDETTMVALDKNNGKVIWKSKSLKDKPSYVSPLLIDRNGNKQIINLTERFIFGVNPENGNIDWTFDYGVYSRGEWKANIQTNTPLYKDGKLFVTNGYDHITVMLDIAKDASSASLAWADSTLDVHHGGAVRVGNYIYGANWLNNGMGNWVCKEWDSGKTMYETKWKNKGSIISADGMLYCYEEKTGNIALVKATPDGFEKISSFKVPLGKGPHWSHLVINNGKLYVRHGQALMAYDIKN